MTTVSPAHLRTGFFDYLFGDQSGILCICTSPNTAEKSSFKQFFFEWPAQKDSIASFLEQQQYSKNVWFGVNLLSNRERKKENCLPCNYVWADLDLAHPDRINPPAQCIIESSPGHYQAYWKLDSEPMPADVCEAYAKRVAYAYSDIGADKSGWDLTQLLRVPFTKNFKYDGSPEVKILHAHNTTTSIEQFENLDIPSEVKVPDNKVLLLDPLGGCPVLETLPDVGTTIYKYSGKLYDTGFMKLYGEEPHEGDDWSARMWRLLMICFEVGMEAEEVFSIALSSKCNKYERDGRPPSYLWREVVKAQGMKQKNIIAATGGVKELSIPTLVNPDEVEGLHTNFIGQYMQWAVQATDAVEEYHELSAMILLSALMSSGLRLKASWGEFVPNLWGLILGDSTLTRKTTAMEMVKNIILDIDKDVMLASEASPEGLLTGLSLRPERTSVFYRDEVSGFFESMNKKEYLASLPELLAELYDVPPVKTKLLRKETITVTKPYFIFFGGGITDKTYAQLSEHHVLSGFLPRFLVVQGKTDLSRIRPTGFADRIITDARSDLVDRCRFLHTIYNQVAEIKIAGQSATIPKRRDAELTEDAKEFFGGVEKQLMEAAYNHPLSMLALPTFIRLGFSGLKMAVLLAGAEVEGLEVEKVTVTLSHIKQAMYYAQKWGRHSVDLIQNTGITTTERELMKVFAAINRNPGTTKSTIMQNYRIGSREMNEVINTLTDRGLITIKRTENNKGMYLWPLRV